MKKKMLVAICLVIVGVIIVVATVYQQQVAPPPEKPPHMELASTGVYEWRTHDAELTLTGFWLVAIGGLVVLTTKIRDRKQGDKRIG